MLNYFSAAYLKKPNKRDHKNYLREMMALRRVI